MQQCLDKSGVVISTTEVTVTCGGYKVRSTFGFIYIDNYRVTKCLTSIRKRDEIEL